MTTARQAFASKAMLFIVAAPLAAQEAVRVPDEATCPRCTLAAKSLATLRPPDDAVVDRPGAVAADRAGRYWMFLEQELPAVYDGAGRFMRSVGRKGAGPGEFQSAQLAMPAGDSVVILDPMARRATIVDATLTPRRYVTLPAQIVNPVVVAWPGDVVGVSILDQRAQAAPPFHRFSFVDADARVVRSLGMLPAAPGSMPASTSSHFLAATADGGFWAAWTYGYNLYNWSGQGTLLRTLQRRPSWFPSEAPSRIGSATRPPDAFVRGVEMDADGLLWVFVQTPADTWREGWPQIQPGQREVSSRSFQFEKMWDTTIEVIDPVAGRVVARQLIERYMVSAIPGRRVAFFSRDGMGEARVDIVEYTLTGR